MPLTLLICTTAVALYYGVLVRMLDALVVAWSARRLPQRLLSMGEVESIVSILVAAVFQVAIVVALSMMLDVDLVAMVSNNFSLRLVGYGVLLGLGEAAVGVLLVYLVLRLLMTVGPAGARRSLTNWSAMSRGGWVRSFQDVRGVLPYGLGRLVTLTYIAVEEMLFRGLVLGALLPHGAVLAVGVSTALFVAAQRTGMASELHAVFPMLTAMVMGVLHGVLFVAWPNILPLIVAHIVVFELVAVSGRPRARRQPELGGLRI